MADSEYLNINTPTFNDQGTPTDVDDQHNPLAAGDFDGVNDWKTSSETPSSVGDTDVTIGFWIQTTSTSSDFVLSQRANSLGVGDGTWDISINNGSLSLAMRDGNNAGIGDSVSNASSTLKDGSWRHVMCAGTVSGGTVDIDLYEDSSEMSYSTQNRKTGTITSMGSSGTMGPLNIAALNPAGAAPFEGVVSRVKVWRSKLNSTQVLAEYNAEVAAIGEGFAAGNQTILDPILSPILSPAIDGILS